jgi:hypothetical protein
VGALLFVIRQRTWAQTLPSGSAWCWATLLNTFLTVLLPTVRYFPWINCSWGLIFAAAAHLKTHPQPSRCLTLGGLVLVVTLAGAYNSHLSSGDVSVTRAMGGSVCAHFVPLFALMPDCFSRASILTWGLPSYYKHCPVTRYLILSPPTATAFPSPPNPRPCGTTTNVLGCRISQLDELRNQSQSLIHPALSIVFICSNSIVTNCE